VLAGVLLAGLASFTVVHELAQAGGSGDRPIENDSGRSGDRDEDFATDDEVIGTLPIVSGEEDDDIIGLLLEEGPPSFYIQGPAQELLAAVAYAGGTAFGEEACTTAEFIPTSREGLGDLRINFHGSLQVGIDSAILAVEGVQFGVGLKKSFGAFGAGLVCGDRVVSTTVLEAGEDFPLPLDAMASFGLLHRVQLLTSDGQGSRTAVSFEQVGGVIEIGQELRPGLR
jgi:hypothetical protein